MTDESVKKHILWQRAIQSDDVHSVRALLREHPYLEAQCVQKFCKDGTWFLLDPLCEAAHRNCIPVAKAILETGKSPNQAVGLAEYRSGRAGAYCLAWATSEEMKSFLIENGADPTTIEGVNLPYLDWETIATGWGDEDVL